METAKQLDRLSWLVYQSIDQPKTFLKKEWHMLVLNCTKFVCRETLQIGFTGRLTELDSESGFQRSIEAVGNLEDGNRIQLIKESGLGEPTQKLAINLRPLSEIKEETDESMLLGYGDPEEIDLEEAEEFLNDGGVIYPIVSGEEGSAPSEAVTFQTELGVPDNLFGTLWDRIFSEDKIDLAYLCICIHAFSEEVGTVGSLAEDKTLSLEGGLNLACLNFMRLDKYSTNGPGSF